MTSARRLGQSLGNTASRLWNTPAGTLLAAGLPRLILLTELLTSEAAPRVFTSMTWPLIGLVVAPYSTLLFLYLHASGSALAGYWFAGLMLDASFSWGRLGRMSPWALRRACRRAAKRTIRRFADGTPAGS